MHNVLCLEQLAVAEAMLWRSPWDVRGSSRSSGRAMIDGDEHPQPDVAGPICRPWLPENLQGGPRCSYSNSHSRLPQVAPDRGRSPLRRRVAVLQKDEGLWGHWHLGLSALRRWTIFLMASVLRLKRIGKALHDDSSLSVDPTRGRMTRSAGQPKRHGRPYDGRRKVRNRRIGRRLLGRHPPFARAGW